MAAEKYSFGAVDSRSNPLSFPPDRALWCKNWVPAGGGWLELRRGYTKVATSSTVPDAGIHSIIPHEMWDGTRYLLVGAGTKLYSLNLATGVCTLVSSALSGNRLAWFPANGQVHIGDGAQVWFFDGVKLRKSGVRALTDEEAAAITVNLGTSMPDLSGVTLAFSSGGNWPQNDATGVLVYAAIWDKTPGTISPFVQLNGGARIKGSTGQKLVATGLPAIGASQLWFLVVTADAGSNPGYISSRVSGHLAQYLPFTSFSAVGSTITVVATAHGLTDGVPIVATLQSFPNIRVLVKATVIDANHYSFVVPSGNPVTFQGAYPVVAGNTINDNAPVAKYTGMQSSFSGFPPSTVQGAQPGYQLFACIWNPTTQAVGNRVEIGLRVKPTQPSTIAIGSLPNLSAEDPELQILIGATNDGGEVPYLLLDTGGNWLSVPSGVTTAQVDGGYVLDQTSEMPYRNGVPPAMDKFCVIGDQVIGCTSSDAFVRVSASAADPINPQVVGDPAQSWGENDVVTFPTREVPTCVVEWNQVALVFSRNYSAPLMNLQGIWDWGQGFPMGCAGRRAFAKSTRGLFWITGQKQLATATDAGPLPISDEYEAALLARIGDQYLGEVEIVACVDVAKRKDELIIKCRDINGAPFEVIHDFRIKDDRSPFGQGYIRSYGDALAVNYTLAEGIDANGVARPYAGGSDGKIYLEESGYNDNGAEFASDYIGIINLGPDKPSVTDVSLWGDRKIRDASILSVSRFTNASGGWEELTPKQDKGDGDKDFKVHHRLKNGEMQFCYFRLQMQSHSADAPVTEMSDPPHYPIEDYGKVFMARVAFGESRGE